MGHSYREWARRKHGWGANSTSKEMSRGCVCTRVCVCTCMQAAQGLLKGRAIEHEHKKGGGLRKQEEDTLRAKLPLFRAGPTCLIERFPTQPRFKRKKPLSALVKTLI